MLFDIHKNDLSSSQLLNAAFLMPLTMCFRNVIRNFPEEFFKVLNGDMFLISLLGKFGNGKFQTNIIPSSYREHSGGVCSMISELEKEYQRKNIYALRNELIVAEDVSAKIKKMISQINQDLVDDMGWLADMNRPSKEHSSVNDDIKITEALKRINDIMKKII